MSELMKVLINRDGLSVSEAEELISNARQMVLEGDDPEEVLMNEFGVEPDYIFDIIG